MSIRAPQQTTYDAQGRPVLQYQERPQPNYRWEPPRLTWKGKALVVIASVLLGLMVMGIGKLMGH